MFRGKDDYISNVPVLILLSLLLSNGVLLIGVFDIHRSILHTGSTLKFLLQIAIQVILSSVQQSAFATWKEVLVVVFSLVSIDIFLSSKTFLAYSAGKGIVVFV